MDLKQLRLTGFKAVGEDDLTEGQFLAYASTWTREPDSYGDVVVKGAFADTITAWKAGSNVLPILYGHDLSDPFSNIGYALDMKEDEHGFLVKAQLDLENPKAMQVYRMLKGKRVTDLSFAYGVKDSAMIEENGVQVRELKSLDLYEVSIVPVGANPDTEVLAVKALATELKAGRVLSTKNLEQLSAARDALDAVIKAASTDSEDEANSGKSAAEALARKAADMRRKSALTMVAYTDAL